MSGQKSTHVSEEKKKILENLKDLIKNNRTILIASIKNLPASQFQEIGKKLRGKAIVKVPKKNLIYRAIDTSDNKELEKLKPQITESVAVLFSDLESYDLAGELLTNKSPAKAKPGQESPEDIEIEAGPTELPPGPAISELGAVGLQVQIQEGKIYIREPRVIVKKGQEISSNVADVMSKLDIKPFSIGFIPVAAFDIREGKLYLELKIDREGTLEELKAAYGKALAFAVEIGLSNTDTIKFLIGKAGSHEKALEALEGNESETETHNDKTDVNNSDDNSKDSSESSETSVEEDSTGETVEASEAEKKGEDKPVETPKEEKVEESKKENTQTPEETKSKGEENK